MIATPRAAMSALRDARRGPRQLADPEEVGIRWLLRFAVFRIASLTGIGWLTLIG